MGKSANISFRDDDEDVWEWMEDMHRNGNFRSRSHVVVYALRKMKERSGDDEVLT